MAAGLGCIAFALGHFPFGERSATAAGVLGEMGGGNRRIVLVTQHDL